MNPGGDLHRAPLTRAQMLAPLSWHEAQLAVCRRYGELSDGTLGWIVVPTAASVARIYAEAMGRS